MLNLHSSKRITAISILPLLLLLAGCPNTTVKTNPPTSKAQIIVMSYGGEFAKAQRIAYFEPFEKETGIKIVEATYNGEYGKIKSSVQSGNVDYDVVDIEASALIRGIKDNLYEKINYDVVDKADLIPQGINPYGVATDFYSVSLGYNLDAFPSSKGHPRTWKDFWDVAKFPGPRSMKKDPRFTLEIALLADGVAPKDLYSFNGGLDVDRAFRSLDKIKSHVKVWWSSGQQPIQFLSSKDVVLAAAFGARIWNAGHKEGKRVDTSWSDDIIDIEYWAIPRGAKNSENAMKFIKFASRADRQAEFSRQIPLGPVNKKAFALLPKDLSQNLNTYPDNLKDQVFLKAEWWAKNEQAISNRWNAWLLSTNR